MTENIDKVAKPQPMAVIQFDWNDVAKYLDSIRPGSSERICEYLWDYPANGTIEYVYNDSDLDWYDELHKELPDDIRLLQKEFGEPYSYKAQIYVSW